MRAQKDNEKNNSQELLEVQNAFRALIAQLLITSPELRSLSLNHEQLQQLVTFLRESTLVSLEMTPNIDSAAIRPQAHGWPQTERLGKTYTATIPDIGKIIVSHYKTNMRVLGILEPELKEKFGFSDRNHPHILTTRGKEAGQTAGASLTSLGKQIFTAPSARQISVDNVLNKFKLLNPNNYLVTLMGLKNIYLARWSDDQQSTALFYFPVIEKHYAFKKVLTHKGAEVWAEIDARPTVYSPEKAKLESETLTLLSPKMKPAY